MKQILFAAAISLAATATQAQGRKDDLGCSDVRRACVSLRVCLDWPQAASNDTDRIKSGNGRLVADGGFACANHHDDVVGGHKYVGDWGRDTNGCLDAGYAQAGRMAVSHACGLRTRRR